METKQMIADGKTALGIEFGSTSLLETMPC